MNNQDLLEKGLNKLVDEYKDSRPLTAEIAAKMLVDRDYKIGILSFMTRICREVPGIIDEIQLQIKLGAK